MGKVNLIDQLRKRGGSSGVSAQKSYARDSDVEFEESSSSLDGGLDAYEKRKVVMLLIGIMLVLGTRQFVPEFVSEKELLVRNEGTQLDQKISVERQKTSTLKMVQEEMRQYDLRMTDLKSKLQKVQQFDEDRNLLVRMTDYIVKEMPARLWFDRIEVDTRTKVLVSGYSSNYQVVSDFMKKLEGAIYFPEWKLVQTENGPPASLSVGASGNSNVIEVPSDSKRFELEAETARL